MSNELLLASIVIFCFLLLYTIFNINIKDKGFSMVFQVLGIVFFLGLVILIGKVPLDDKDFCYLTVANSTQTGSMTSYQYDRVCFTNPNNSPLIFYKAVTWFIRIVAVMLIIYFGYIALTNLSDIRLRK